ncbi:unnamed protein product [Gordionus sp. m RMFG-2023]
MGICISKSKNLIEFPNFNSDTKDNVEKINEIRGNPVKNIKLYQINIELENKYYSNYLELPASKENTSLSDRTLKLIKSKFWTSKNLVMEEINLCKQNSQRTNELFGNHPAKRNVIDSNNGESIVTGIPLSEKDIYCLKKSWKGVCKQKDEAGGLIVTKLIESHPEYKKHFETRNGIELPPDLQISTTGQNFMYALDKFFAHLEDPEAFLLFANDLGGYHVGIKHFKSIYFLDFAEPCLNAVKEILGDRYTCHMEIIYIRIMDFIVTKLIESYENTQKNQYHFPN